MECELWHSGIMKQRNKQQQTLEDNRVFYLLIYRGMRFENVNKWWPRM
jgi:hypothetical protein